MESLRVSCLKSLWVFVKVKSILYHAVKARGCDRCIGLLFRVTPALEGGGRATQR
jgi:hypothetical protein